MRMYLVSVRKSRRYCHREERFLQRSNLSRLWGDCCGKKRLAMTGRGIFGQTLISVKIIKNHLSNRLVAITQYLSKSVRFVQSTFYFGCFRNNHRFKSVSVTSSFSGEIYFPFFRFNW